MGRILFAPFSIAGGLLAGLAATKLFEFIWARFDDQEPPDPEHREVSWPKLAVALILQGAIFRFVRGSFDHGARTVFFRGTPKLAWRRASRAQVTAKTDGKEQVMAELNGKRIAFVTANEGVEQVELEQPWQAIEDAGGIPELLAPEEKEVQAFDHLDKGDTFDVTRPIGEANPDEFDALVLPGGVANPDQLRTHPEAVRFVRSFFESGKPVAAICHAPWTLIEAGVVDGRTLTSWPSLETDLRNAGATWVDEEVVVDSGLVTSRKPDDLEAFCAKMVEEIAEGEHAQQREKSAA